MVRSALLPSATVVLIAVLQLVCSGPQSQLATSPAFRGGRVRPMDQQGADTTQQSRPVPVESESKARSTSSTESSFVPMSPSAVTALGGQHGHNTAPRPEQHKTTKKGEASSAEQRTGATARNVNPSESSSPNAFRFPSRDDKPRVTPVPAMAKSYHFPVTETRNATSRFFSFNTDRQALDLGLSFTVPFVSIPMSSLVNIGETTSTALSSLLSVNWPSMIAIGAAVLAASFLLPTVVQWISSVLLLKTSAATNFINQIPTGYSAPDGDVFGAGGGYYSRSFEAVSPLSSLLEQLDDALAQYDLDATSCMQRAVCTTVADSEDSVARGDTDPTQLIINGISRSSWTQMLFGQSSFSRAVEVGRSGSSCKKQFPKCPFSLAGVLRFLASYAALVK